ncbi:MAG: DUF1570 domain-containing protein [Planctomycetaceae bacterium]|nr:DUF1570 domain-containing protein [Planctomycetaceae bacterium]
MNRHFAVLARLCFVVSACCAASATAADESPLVRLTFQAETPSGRVSDERTLDGKIVAEPEGAGILFLDRGGRLWPITPDRLKSREETGETFTPFSQAEMADALKAEFGDGFEIVTTRHYVLCTEAGREYARWAGMLFERLMGAFKTNWDKPQLDFHEPEFPLCAVILRDKASFAKFALADAGPGVLDALGYYSTLSNRMVMYDLTAGVGGSRPRNAVELNAKLNGQVANVSTIVHEATHQIAFNSGIHVRMADNPFWLVEGLAMYFETPDLSNAAGWRTVGRVNTPRLRKYGEYIRNRRPADSLKAMLSADEKFHAANTALDSYSEAWALTYYLIKTKRAAYMTYLASLNKKGIALKKDTADERLAEFEAAFGDFEDVERGFIRYMNNLSRP